MLENIEQNAVLWIYGFAFLALLITIIGVLAGAKLPTEQGKARTRKFALVGAAIFFFAVPVFKPLVWSYSGVRNLDEIKVSELATNEEIVKLEKEQTRQIERLKEEVVELRQDVRRMNQYYSTIFQLLSNLAAMLCIIFAFRKDEKTVENISD
jgi:CBS domain containing-hemolysin-like protein